MNIHEILSFWWILAVLIPLIFWKFTLRFFFGMVIIPEDKIGMVNKKFVLFGANRTLPDGRIVATNGEAGIQAQTLAPGLYWAYWVWQYEIIQSKFTVIPHGELGLILAKDGAPIPIGRILAQGIPCDNFQDAVTFISKGGQKGRQAAYITAGSYRINTLLFEVQPVKMTRINDNAVGLITTLDGAPLEPGEIAGKTVPGHNNFQDSELFFSNGGQKGRQAQVVLAGSYNLNPWFVNVEQVPMTEIEIGHAGVVISFIGEEGKDQSGAEFKHGNIVEEGQKGVWQKTLDPGKYAINTYTMKVESVPTTNIVLNWATGRNESHNLDGNLSTITVRSSDGFQFNLDVSQIIHVPATDAPKVIARFGSMQNLVSQVLEPTIGNYFRNSAQKNDVISFLSERSERQEEAKGHIERVLDEYNVHAVDTLIGDIVPPESVMKTLTDKKIAELQKSTFETQKNAQEQRKLLESATASADMQKEVMKSEQEVIIAERRADAKIKTATGDANAKTINAKADAEVTTLNGDAVADRTRKIGTAEADVMKLKVGSIGGDGYTRMNIAQYLAENKIKLVPEILVQGSDGNGGILAGLIGNEMLKDLMNKNKEKEASTDKAEVKKEDEKK